MFWPIVSIGSALLSFAVAAYFYIWVRRQPAANETIERIGGLVRNGAFAFLRREYRILSVFVCVVAVLILLFFPTPFWNGPLLRNAKMAGVYIAGTVLSALAGVIGISISTIANRKAAAAAQSGLEPSFMAGFRGGAVMGMLVVGTSLIGAAGVYIITEDPEMLISFSFGASSLTLFAKAGGGIFTKTADIAADLTGKVELGIPEDDPRNPAVIADNVGDNVGDVAGMGADLFDSNIASLAAALVLAVALGGKKNIDVVFSFASIGLLSSIIGVLTTHSGRKNPGKALNGGTTLTMGVFAVLTFAASLVFGFELRLWGAVLIGLAAGSIIGLTTDVFTKDSGKPVQHIARAGTRGPAFTIISGFSFALTSTLPSLFGIGAAAMGSFYICQPLGSGYAMFGIALAALGMLSVVGMIISNDAYGPIVDNARGLAEMGGLGPDVLSVTDQLDAAGNTAKAITKGFSIGAAGLTVIALLAAYREIVVQKTGEALTFSIMDPLVFFGLLAGVAVPAVFSAMLMLGVDRNAERMVDEIRRQFREIPGLMEGIGQPEYVRCIDIATTGALRELVPAGLVAIVSTLVVGFIGGVHAIGGFLTGNILSGLLLALLMSNAGGMWDNAKKYVEAGNFGGKGTDAHKASVIGDTVGDPFKDTAGPSLNTQITVVSLVSSLTAGLFITTSLL